MGWKIFSQKYFLHKYFLFHQKYFPKIIFTFTKNIFAKNISKLNVAKTFLKRLKYFLNLDVGQIQNKKFQHFFKAALMI